MQNPSEDLINYYRLCGIFPRSAHVVNELSKSQVDIVLTKKEINLYLRSDDTDYHIYKVNEFVVGGCDSEPKLALVIE